MDSKELRIGNYVDYERTTHVIREIHSDKVLHTWYKGSDDRYYSPYNDIEGIELTDDEIKQLGIIPHVLEKMLDNLDPFRYEKDNKMKYVHQLQNFWYSITGVELTYK